MSAYRVLIVDDSRFMRKVFSDLINAEEAFTVAATASDGEEAVRLAIEVEPDIITMDLEMPRMNGLEALRRIMAVRPGPVIMLSAVTANGTRNTIRALQYGAFDFIRKPDGAVKLDIDQVGMQLLEKLRTAAESIRAGGFRMLPAVEDMDEASAKADSPPVSGPAVAARGPEPPGPSPEIPRRDERPVLSPITTQAAQPKKAETIRPVAKSTVVIPKQSPLATPPARPAAASGPPKAKPAVPPASQKPAGDKESRRSPAFTKIVAVGTSTGGPRALHELLTKLPEGFAAPVLVVQHMPPKFTHSLAQRLNSFCAIRVCEASQNEIVQTATAYIAPGGKQMTLVKDASAGYRIKLTEEGPRSGHMPSVDVLFESLVGYRGLSRHAVLMTGMGSDGAKGMKALKEDGVQTLIAEAEETCVVYGMPRSAVELGAVSHVLPLQQIASVLVREVITGS